MASPAPRRRLVAIAIDSVGSGGRRPYSYEVPGSLGDLAPGEAVIVPFGRRSALGIVLGDASDDAPDDVRAISDRVRTDGPLVPPLTLALARHVSDHYFAPPAVTLRAFLPPGMLERLELVAEATPAGLASDLDGEDAALSDQLRDRARPVRSVRSAEGRPAVLRRLRALEARGLVHLDWVLGVAGARPRYVRWLVVTDAGRRADADGGRVAGRRLGARTVAALSELVSLPGGEREASRIADSHGASAAVTLVRRGLAVGEARETPRRPLTVGPPARARVLPRGAALTTEQAGAVASIVAAIEARDSRPFLLTGVTGAGKTAVYAAAITACLEHGRRALALVPEVTHARILADRLRADGGMEVALVHSGLSDGERADEWRRIREGSVDVVVGTRLAITSPIADIGLVLVDEEHDAAYKSDRTPRLQARDVAVRLGDLAGAAVVLGSATPAVESEGRARDGTYRRISITERASGAPPRIEIVDLRVELAAGNRGLISERLARDLAGLDVAGGDQAILVINRRGAASVVLCRDCGTVQSCPECGRPLVFHQAGMSLRCHHCGAATPLADRCPSCRSPRIRYLGGGTQRVEREVRERFPGLRVGRLDRDVAERRGAADRVVEAFADGRLDVLVGTTLVAKALDVPSVTLVGVVSADIALNLPDERAAERTFQLLVQAVGRAGRGERPGTAIIQTYQPGHPVIRAVATGTPDAFYDAELAQRRRFHSPPYGRIVKLVLGHPDWEHAIAAATAMAETLRARAVEATGTTTYVSGPAAAFIPRRAGRWRFIVVVRGDDPVSLLGEGPGREWSVDVDPDSVL